MEYTRHIYERVGRHDREYDLYSYHNFEVYGKEEALKLAERNKDLLKYNGHHVKIVKRKNVVLVYSAGHW